MGINFNEYLEVTQIDTHLQHLKEYYNREIADLTVRLDSTKGKLECVEVLLKDLHSKHISIYIRQEDSEYQYRKVDDENEKEANKENGGSDGHGKYDLKQQVRDTSPSDNIGEPRLPSAAMSNDELMSGDFASLNARSSLQQNRHINVEADYTTTTTASSPQEQAGSSNGSASSESINVLPQFKGLTKLDAVWQIFKENKDRVLHPKFIMRSLYGELSEDNQMIAMARVREILVRGKQRKHWRKVPDSGGCYALNVEDEENKV